LLEAVAAVINAGQLGRRDAERHSRRQLHHHRRRHVRHRALVQREPFIVED
jgi:hypothetical protein